MSRPGFSLPPGETYEWPLSESLVGRFWEKVEVHSGCWAWLAFCNPQGYGMIRNAGRMALAHRVSWVIHFGRIPDGKQALHHCDNPPCTNPDHLYLGTNLDNVRDKVERGRSSVPQPKKRGEGHPLVKLSNEDVLEIRGLLASGEARGFELSERFGVSQSTICQIKKRRVWKHI